MMTLGGRWLQRGKAAGGSSGPFDPSQLFSSGQQGYWYDESTIGSMFQDSAATTPETAYEQLIGRLSDRSGRGNHGLQATAGNRPAYSARVNQFIKTALLTDAAWYKVEATITGGFADPNGGTGAFLLTDTLANNYHDVGQAVASGVGTVSTLSIILKSAGKQWVSLGIGDGPNYFTYFDLTNGVVGTNPAGTTPSIFLLGNGWYICSISRATTATQVYGYILAALVDGTNTYLGTGAACMYMFKPQMEYGPVRTTHQAVDTATSYDTVGFPAFASTVGSKSLTSSTGGGGNTGFFFCQAIKPVTGGVLQTLFSDATDANGTGYRLRINAANKLELGAGKGIFIAAPNLRSITANLTGGTLIYNQAYWYLITATIPAGESPPGNQNGAVANGPTNTSSITIGWDAVAGNNSYKIYRGTAYNGQNTSQYVGNVTSFTDTGANWQPDTPPAVDAQFVKAASAAALPIGSTTLVTAWDDGTTLNVQLGTGAVTSIARPGTVAAGTAGFSTGQATDATNYFIGNWYPALYRQGIVSASDRTGSQNYCKSKAGLA